jgi:hypothetical protein
VIRIEMSNMNVYTKQRKFHCPVVPSADAVSFPYEIIIDENHSRNMFKDNIGLLVEFTRNLSSKYRKDLPNNKFAVLDIPRLSNDFL